MTINYLDSKRIQMIAGSDALGSAVDGTNSSTATNVSTPINGQTSVEFGNNEYANSMGTTSSFSTLVGSNWSVSFWLHYAGVGNNGWGAGSAGSGNLGTLLTTGQISNTGNGFVIGLDDNNQEKFYLLIASGQGTSGRSFDDVFTDAIALASDKWHHYVFNFDNTSDELKIYRDGSLVQTIAYDNTVPTPSATTTSAFTMGRQGEMDQRYFIGEMADVGIFNRNLTTTEISYLFNSFDPDSATSSSNTGKSISTMSSSSGLLTNYKLDDVNYTNSAVAPTKPTNVQDNSILVEKDTGIRYFSTKAEIAPTTTANFTGSANDHVDIPVSVAMKSFTNGSVAFWMYVNSTTPNSGDNVAFSVSDTTSGSKEWVIGYYGSTDKISLLSRTSSSSKVLEYKAGTLTKDKWYHIVYTNNTSTGNKLYIDGVLTTPSYTAGSASTNCFFNGLNINTSTLGANKDSGGYQWALDGNLQQVLLYNKTLTQSEVNSLYNGGYYNQFPDSINLVRNYELDTNVNNSQAPWNNGTATGITYTSLSIPNRPYTWNMQPISVDFQSNPLTSSSTKVFYNHKTHKIDYNLSGTEVHVGARGTIDLQELNGGALSSSWVLDFDINDTGVIMTSDGRLSTNIGVSTLNVNNSSDTAVGAFVGLHADIDDDNTSRGAYGICAYSTGTEHNPNSHITPFETINQNQHWYVRLIKDGVADTFKAEFYANSERIGTPLSATVTGVTWDTPRYFGVFDDHDLGGTNSHVGNIGQIALYNGVTTVN